MLINAPVCPDCCCDSASLVHSCSLQPVVGASASNPLHIMQTTASQPQSQRSSTRARQAPMHYAEEQALLHLEAQELLDLRHAEAASLESDVDQESPDEPSPPALPSDNEEEEERKSPPPAWTEALADAKVPPFEALTGKQHGARHAQSPLEFLQLFLPPGLLQQ